LRKLSGWPAWYWSTQLAVIAVGAMSLSLEDSKSVWLFLSLCVATAAVPDTSRSLFDVRRAPIMAVDAESIYRRNGQAAGRRAQPARLRQH